MKRSSLVLALFFAALSLLIATSCSQQSTNDNSAASKPKPTRPAPDFTVSATDLLNEVKADKSKAKEKYTGKQIAVTGRVTFVVLAETPMTVMLDAGREYVLADFDATEKESIATLKGKNVTIQCLGGDTHWYAGSPDLEHCVIVKVE